MTAEETAHINNLFEGLRLDMKGIAQDVHEVANEVATIKRGVYGDAQNEVPGLIQTDRDQHKRIRSLEQTKRQFIWTFGGVLLALEVLWQFIKTKIGL